MTDLSPRETAARALHGLRCEHDLAGQECTHEPTAWYTGEMLEADAVLAAVAAHDGLAEVLRAHQERVTTVRDRRPVLLCECGQAEADHLADVVRAWMVQP